MSAPTAAEMITAIDSFLYGNIGSGAVREYQIAGKKISKYSITELLALRQFDGVTVRVCKPHIPYNGIINGAEVEITRWQHGK